MVPTASRPHPRPELRRRQAPALPSPRRLRRARLSPPPPGALPHSRPALPPALPAPAPRPLPPGTRPRRPALPPGTLFFARSRSVPQHGTRGTAPPRHTALGFRSIAIRSSARNARHSATATTSPTHGTRSSLGRDPFLSTERATPTAPPPSQARSVPQHRTRGRRTRHRHPARSVPQHRTRPTIFRAPARCRTPATRTAAGIDIPRRHPARSVPQDGTRGRRPHHPGAIRSSAPKATDDISRTRSGVAPRRHARQPESTSHVAGPARSVPQHGTRPTRFRVRARCRVLAQFEIPAGWLSFRCRLYSTERNGRPRVA